RLIEMDFMAARAKFRDLVAHKRLQKNAPMGLRIQLHHKVMQATDRRILTGRQRMQRWIFEREIALAHRALYLHNAVAHETAQASPCFRLVDILLDRLIHHATEE